MKAIATFSLAALLALPGISCAQDKTGSDRNPGQNGRRETAQGEVQRTQERQAEPGQREGSTRQARRLESVTWNSVQHALTWVISKGEKQGAAYKQISSASYEISMDDATMTFNGEKRRFSKEEAANVRVLMDLVAKYAVDSTVWWDEGHGLPADRKQRPEKESVAVLHVAARPAPAIAPEALQQQIDALRKKLAELKQLQQTLEPPSPVRLTSY